MIQHSGNPGQYVLFFGARPQNPGVTYVDHYPVLREEYSERLQAIQRALHPLPPWRRTIAVKTSLWPSNS
jgi:hypothetical protein